MSFLFLYVSKIIQYPMSWAAVAQSQQTFAAEYSSSFRWCIQLQIKPSHLSYLLILFIKSEVLEVKSES